MHANTEYYWRQHISAVILPEEIANKMKISNSNTTEEYVVTVGSWTLDLHYAVRIPIDICSHVRIQRQRSVQDDSVINSDWSENMTLVEAIRAPEVGELY